MQHAFDYIAMPKGHSPGGPIQASTGDWFLVMLADGGLAWHVKTAIAAAKQAGRLLDEDIDRAIEGLQAAKNAPDALSEIKIVVDTSAVETATAAFDLLTASINRASEALNSLNGKTHGGINIDVDCDLAKITIKPPR